LPDNEELRAQSLFIRSLLAAGEEILACPRQRAQALLEQLPTSTTLAALCLLLSLSLTKPLKKSKSQNIMEITGSNSSKHNKH
jgi:hypothetical protein